MPRPSENEPLVWQHFKIFAADLMLLAVVRLEAHAKRSAHAHIHLRLYAVADGVSRAEPVNYFFGVRPGSEDFGGRRFEASCEGEAWLGEHVSSSTKAARRSSCADQNRW